MPLMFPGRYKLIAGGTDTCTQTSAPARLIQLPRDGQTASEIRALAHKNAPHRGKLKHKRFRTTQPWRFESQTSGRDGTRTRDPYHVEVVL